MNRKYNILTDELLQKSSTKLNKRRIERKNSFTQKDTHFSHLLNLEEEEEPEPDDIFKNYKTSKSNNNKLRKFDKRKTLKNSYITSTNLRYNTIENSNSSNNTNNNKFIKINNNNPFEENQLKKRICLKKNKKQLININDEKKINKTNNNTDTGKLSPTLNKTSFITYKTKKNNNK
jgi:hypothetical protein